MKIGVPTEIKPQENRVALTPAGAERLTQAGHVVTVQSLAGVGSGFDDSAYAAVGAHIAPDAKTVFAEADMIVKVKEPLPQEYGLLKEGQTLFTYLHLAASRELTEAMIATGAYCFAYETLEHGRGLPLLTPMSEVAGRMSVQEGAKHLEKPMGGSGILLGGVPGVPRAKVMVIGAGIVGVNAARMACGLGADVILMDIDLDRLRYLDEVMPPNCRTLYSQPLSMREQLPNIDLLIGAVLIPGGAAPKLVRREDLSLMREGSVIVDVAVDQGGCVETCRPTTHEDPTFVVDGIVHYCVANMPGAVPRTSTMALTNATLAWMLRLANLGPVEAVRQSRPLATASNVMAGTVTYPAVAEAFGLDHVPPMDWATDHARAGSGV